MHGNGFGFCFEGGTAGEREMMICAEGWFFCTYPIQLLLLLLVSAGHFQWQEPSRCHCPPTSLALSPICWLLESSCPAFLWICPLNVFVSARLLGFLGWMGSARVGGEQPHQHQQEGPALARVAGKGGADGSCVSRHADGGGKGWGCWGRCAVLPLMSLRER